MAYSYRLRITKETHENWAELAHDMGYTIDTKGAYYGKSSPRDLVTAEMTARAAHPAAFAAGLQALIADPQRVAALVGE